MITREQVADLHEGDVVELGFASGSIVRGPLVEDRHTGSLVIADAGWTVRSGDGALAYGLERHAETLAVIERAPRPLYVNHDRTEPVSGDVVRDADSDDVRTWMFSGRDPSPGYNWRRSRGPGFGEHHPRPELPKRLRLLVDGETGQVVP